MNRINDIEATAIVRTLIRVVLVLSGFLFHTMILASENAGISTANFLVVNPDARISAMGQSSVAVIDDADSVNWNPAILGLTRHREFSLSTMKFNGITDDFLEGSRLINMNIIYAMPYDNVGMFGSLGTFGISFIYTDQGEVPITTTSPDVSGVFTPYSYSMQLSWGNKFASLPVLEYMPFGASVKFINQSIHDYSSLGFAVDFGFAFVFPNQSNLDGLVLAASLLNLGGVSAFIQESDPLPLTYKFGASYSMHIDSIMKVFTQKNRIMGSFEKDLIFSADLTKNLDNNHTIHLGAEVKLLEVIAIRLGYEVMQEARGFTVGMGVSIDTKQNRYQVDFAWVPQSVLGDTFRLTFNYLWDTRNYLKKNQIKESILDDYGSTDN